MKQRNYTQKDLKISRLIAILLTVIYFITRSICLLGYAMTLPDAVDITVGLWDMFMPVLLIFGWGMYLERYLYLELLPKEECDISPNKRKVYIGLLLRFFLGIVTFFSMLGVVFFNIKYWNWINELYCHLTIKVTMACIWLFGWIYSIKAKNMLGVGTAISKKRVLIGFIILFLMLVLSVCVSYRINVKAAVIRYTSMG